MKLRDYRKKRSAEATNEPFGGEPPEELPPTMRGAFVVHLHDATRTHYDLRLEIGGVLASFAVPKGPSLDPESKHLAVHTEDHPLEYLDFEDIIPEGQYGAGPMIVWDRGRVEYLDKSAEEGVKSGKLDFLLFSHKLGGRFALVRLKTSEKDWLLFKKKDAWSKPGSDIIAERPESVLSGLTIDQLARSEAIGAAMEADAAKLGAKKRAVVATDVAPALPFVVTGAPRGKDWLHEARLGGVRMIAAKTAEAPVLAHAGHDMSDLYPEIARAVRALPPSRVVLDGEIVAFDPEGRPSSARLLQRLERARAGDLHGAQVDFPVVMLVSDVLAIGARDVRSLPLEKRRALLAKLVPVPGPLRASDAYADDPSPIAAFCRAHGLHGVLSRKRDGAYDAGTKAHPAWTEHVVTAGETARQLDAPPPPVSREVPVTNRAKIFWPDEGYTKGDLVSYYQAIAPAILPYLRDRPISVVRYPDGIQGKSFYQWNVPPGMPRWVTSFALKDEDDALLPPGQKPRTEKRVFVVNDEPSLIYIANLACIPIHILACRRDSLEVCDFLTVDFDLKLAKLEHAVAQALTLRGILDDIGLPGFAKSSGQSGLHVLVPLGAGTSFTTARALADLLGQLIVREHPDTATMERIVKKRGEKVYVDTGQTGRVRTIVAPYSVRAHPGATVSTPLRWEEVTPKLDPKRFTIRTVPARFEKEGDPMHPMLESAADVAKAIGRLERIVAPRV